MEFKKNVAIIITYHFPKIAEEDDQIVEVPSNFADMLKGHMAIREFLEVTDRSNALSDVIGDSPKEERGWIRIQTRGGHDDTVHSLEEFIECTK